MNNKICHVTSAHPRYDVRIFRKQCTSLSKAGYQTYLLVNDEFNDEIKDGVSIISTNMKVNSRLKRFLSLYKALLNRALEVDADIYHLHDPDLLLLGNKLKSKGKCVIFDSHEDVPVQIREKTWIKPWLREFISFLYEKFESYSIGKYDAIISVTPHIVERLSLSNRNTHMITNYPIVDRRESINERSPQRKICFAGGISPQWNHDKIIEAINDIADIEYVLVGKLGREYSQHLKSIPGWDKVDFRGVLSYLDVKEIYKASSIGMALNYTRQAGKHGTLGNTKLFEYMGAGLPVICTNYSLWKEVVEECNCGICVDPKNVTEIKNAINTILNNSDLAQAMGRNGRKSVLKKYNWETQENKLIKLYDSLREKCKA